MPGVVRLYPHIVKGEGQFVALLKKKSENFNGANSALKLTNSKITKDFIKENLNIDFDCVEYKNYNYYVLNKDVVKKHVNYVSVGVRLGQINNGRFEPHHNLFTAFGNNFNNTIELNFNDEKVKKYLKGDIFEVENPDGYGAIIVNNCSLGGYKISKGKLKNYYPKGLRNF